MIIYYFFISISIKISVYLFFNLCKIKKTGVSDFNKLKIYQNFQYHIYINLR